jgi:hypothetical protein
MYLGLIIIAFGVEIVIRIYGYLGILNNLLNFI